MGHALAHRLHFIWQAEETQTWGNPFFVFLGVTQADNVPIGQNEHQVRGA